MMRRLNPLPDNYVVQHCHVGHHHGQDDFVIVAGLHGEGDVWGYLSYSTFRDIAFITYIEVKPEHRRDGVARDLWAEFSRHNPGVRVNYGTVLPDAVPIVEALERRRRR
jgi:ribosomal protein S18 acetylase RimI-like enzyme